MTTPANNPLALPATETPERNGTPEPSLSDRVRSLRLPGGPDTGGSGGFPWFAWVLVFLLGATAVYLGYRVVASERALAELATAGGGSTGAPTGTSTSTGAPTGGGTTASPGSRALETGGYLIPVRRVQVSPRVGGQVIKMFYEEGEHVEAGMPLAIIDRTRFSFTFRERSAQAAALKAEWERLQAALKIEEEIRAANLAEGVAHLANMQTKHRIAIAAGRAATEEDVRNAQLMAEQAAARVKNLQGLLQVTRDTAKIEVDKAYHNYQQAKIAAEAAEDDLDNTVVPAPSSGIILKKYAEDGNMVRPEAFSNGLSASLYDLADLTQMEVDVDISERDLEAVFLKQRCEVRMEAFPERVYTGYVARIQPEASRSKAAVSARVRVEVPSGDRYLRPELRARVRFLPAPPEKK